LIFDPYLEVSKTAEWYIDILKTLMHMWAWGLVAWHLVGKRGVEADPWE
jgi:hypothetical protein